MKETNLVLCACDEHVFLELVASEQVFGHPDEFVMHMADYYSMPDDVQAKVAHKPMFTE